MQKDYVVVHKDPSICRPHAHNSYEIVYDSIFRSRAKTKKKPGELKAFLIYIFILRTFVQYHIYDVIPATTPTSDQELQRSFGGSFFCPPYESIRKKQMGRGSSCPSRLIVRDEKNGNSGDRCLGHRGHPWANTFTELGSPLVRFFSASEKEGKMKEEGGGRPK